MKYEPLTIPTDVEIIELLSAEGRQTPANVAAHLERDSRYMSERLRELEKREYIRDAPPAERSGMYELTRLGSIVAFHAHSYVRDYHKTFDASCRVILDNQPDDTFYPDLITLDEPGRAVLHILNNTEGLTVPSKLVVELSEEADYSPDTPRKSLFSLSCSGLAERVDGMDVYRSTELGEKAMELYFEGVTDPVERTEKLREIYSAERKERLEKVLNTVS